MSTKKLQFYKLLTSLLLAALLLGSSGSAVWASTDAGDTKCDCCEQTGEQQVVELSQGDPLLEALKQTPEVEAVEANFGVLSWDQATLRETEGSPWQVIIVPVENKKAKDEAQLLLAGTKDGKHFRILVFGLKSEKASADKSEKFNGSLKFYAPTGELAVAATYKDSVLQEVNQTSETVTSGLDWGCFLGCIGRTVPPGCIAPCSVCAAAPSPYDPFCYVCAGCIGYGAFICIIACWT